MSVLRLYSDTDLTTQITKDADFTNPDTETSLDGTAGETATEALWIAIDQTTLAAAITSVSATTITLTAARFPDTDYSVIIIDSEKMLITAGHGTTSLTVTRGYNDTTAATHLIAAAVRSAYDCTSVTIDCVDDTGTDESGWVTFCDDDGEGSPDGSYAAPHTPDDGIITYDESKAIWRRIVVPALTAATYKQDLILRISATINETI